jgi:hypothetical protein
VARARLIEFCPCPQPRLSSAELHQEAKLGDDLKLERKESVRPRERRVFKVRHENPTWFGPMSANAKTLRVYL